MTGVPGSKAPAGHVLPFWRAAYEVARKDILVFARTKRLFIFGGIFALGILSVTIFWAYFFQEFFGGAGEIFGGLIDIVPANAVLGLALGFPLVGAYYWISVLGIIFSFDAVVREYEDKSLFLVLAKPVQREAVVVGKYLGAVFGVSTIFIVLATVAYFVAQVFTGAFAPPSDFLRYYLGLGLLLLGMLALSSMALLFSAVTRSTTVSVILSLLTWVIILNVLSGLSSFIAQVNPDVDPDDLWVRFLQYANPTNTLGPAVEIILNLGQVGDQARAAQIGGFASGFGLDPATSALSMLAFIAVFLGATMLVVNKKNFE